MAIIDGPFAETKEQIGGFILIAALERGGHYNQFTR
jgi:hypothetical protein